MTLKVCQDWGDQYIVGDTLVDSEHKRIIEMACSFAKLIEADALSYREALNTVREVIFHITTHFQHEELLLELYNADAADIERHKREHIKLKAILQAAIDDIRDQKTIPFKDACIALANDLYDLVADHITTVDKETLQPCISAHDKVYHRAY